MCGIIGIQGTDSAAAEIFQGLLLLQHRGQDAAGILSFDQHTQQFHLHKDKGLVGSVFNEKNLATLEGNSAIAHPNQRVSSGQNIQREHLSSPCIGF